MKTTILVTGAAWCLWSNLVRKLAEDETNEIRILIKPWTWHPFLDGIRLQVFYGDIRNMQDVQQAMQGCDKAYQVAGVVSYAILDNQDMYTTHVDGVRNMLDCALKCAIRGVVVTASTAWIGIPENPQKPLTEEAPFHPRYNSVMYMYSKHQTIALCKEYAQKGLRVVCISPTTLYGQGDISMHIGKMIQKIAHKNTLFVPPGGNAVVSIDDTVAGHIFMMERGISGENYILADECIPYIDMFRRVAKLLWKSPRCIIIPSVLRWILRFFCTISEYLLFPFHRKPPLSPRALNFTFRYRYFDAKKARTLGWKPQQSFEQSITKAVEFYKHQGLL